MKLLLNGSPADLPTEGVAKIIQDGDRLLVKTPSGTHSALAVRRGDVVHVSYQGKTYEISKPSANPAAAGAAGSGESKAPMPGAIVEITAKPDQTVKKGDKLLVLEAMKMQLPIASDIDGVVTQINVKVGDQVEHGQLLAVVKPAQED